MRSKHLNGTVRAAANQNVKERDYWLKQLSGELIKSSFPTDRKKTPNEQSMAVVKSTFPGEIDSQLTALTKGNHNVLHIYMTAALTVLLSKYTGRNDIIFASPIYKQTVEGQFINTLLPLRNHLHGNMTFKELLVQVKQTLVEAIENQNYPIEILAEKLNMPFEGNDFPLFDIGLLIENIHDKAYFKSIPINMIFSFIKKEACFEAEVEYNSCLYEKSTIEGILIHLQNLLDSVLFNLDLTIPNIDILLEKEKEQLLNEFNCTEVEYPGSTLIHEGFAAQAAKTPDNIAVSAAIDLSDIYDHLQPGEKIIEIDSHLQAMYEKCCFRKNPFLFLFDLQIPGTKEVFKLVKTHCHNSVVMNHNAFKLLDLFDGKQNLKSLFVLLKNEKIKLLIYSMSTEDVLEISYDFNDKNEILLHGKFEDFISVIKVLYNNHLLDLAGYQSAESLPDVNSLDNYFDKNETPGYQMNRHLEKILRVDKKLSKAQVLLLGDTPGMATTGLLYLASYLRRNGIKSFCRFYDHDRDKKSLEKNIYHLLQEIQPEVVAVSMKWFLHIARVLETCKIIKEYSSQIKVVVGGNTASYYPEEIIHNEHIDYLVCGDGEVPLLEICRGDSFIQNCIYKKNGKPIKNPITYIEDETNGKEIYLSHLEEILLSGQASLFGSFFIYTHKGCLMNCLYCGGCHAAHKKKFNRSSFYKRGISQVRRDIIEAKKYTSTFFFDFDAPNPKLEEYCKAIWAGIDLSSHFCILGNLIPPSAQLVELVTRTFKYVYWNLDIASLSEKHRLELFSKGLVKPQPTDTEIEAFFAACEKYDNNEIRVNLIAGLPFFTKQDIKTSERVLNHLMNTYKCFGELHWARLHAQPGAPVTLQAENFNMHSYAKTFRDFLTYSERNYKYNSIYPGVEYFDYPYVYYNDEDLNSGISKHYLEMNRKVVYFRENKRKQVIFCRDISYRKLDTQTNQLARELGEKGVMPGEIVALMVEDPLEVTVGIIGILKAGAAYLPIDPHYPEERIDFMLKDSNAKILVTYPGSLEKFRKLSIVNCQLLMINEGPHIPPKEANSINNYQLTINNSQLKGNNLSYLIYTSGSMGQPKGVLIRHTGLVNYTYWRLTAYGYTEKDITLQLLSYSFDGFCSNFYSSLLSGGTLVIVPGSKRLDIDYIKNIVRNRGVTNMSIVPGIYNALLKTAETKDLEKLRFIVLAGEKTAAGIMEKSKEKSPYTRLINEYGPTETTVTAAANLEMNPHNPDVIGKPIANTAIYILDPWHNPVPLGVTGELCITGPGVGRGYLNNPELTAERFCLRRPGGALSAKGDRCRLQVQVKKWKKSSETIPSLIGWVRRTPTPPGPPCKNFLLKVSGFYMSYKSYKSYVLYRTGDQARWLPDGDIEFLGRLDTQVKVRGFRIELEEIENCLLKREDIKEAILVVREAGQAENYLCAYFVSSGDIDPLELEEYLSKDLPPYMVPSSFIRIEKIPLTPGGKVDRQGLPGVEVKRKYTAPRNNVEEKLAMIWAEVLNLEKPIGIDDDFFELGGQSLKTTVLISKIHKEFNIKIPHADIFKITTIRGVYEYINKTTASIYSSIEREEKKEYYPQSSAQKRLFFLNRLDEMEVSYNTPVALKIKGEISKDQFEKVFSILISRHEPLRTGFELIGSKPVQRVNDQVNMKLEYYDLTANDIKTTPQSKVFAGDPGGQFFQKAPPWPPEAITKNFIRPFDLSAVPLLRAGLWKLARQEHLFLFDMHHIIADGASMGILISEFTRLYAEEDLPALRIQYKDFSVWQNHLFETGQIKDQENYWSNLYSDEIPRLNLSTDYPRPGVFNFTGDKYVFELEPVEASAFEEMGSSAGATLYMNLLAAFYVLLHKYTGQEDIVVGSGIMGRPHSDMRHLIGMFVNSLAMRNYPRPTMTYRRFLGEVKKNCLQAYENQDVQFEDLVEKINPPRDPSRNPIFDVSLIFQDFKQSILTIKDVTFVPSRFENNTSKFDMSLFIYPGDDSIRFSLEYCTALFSRDTIKRLSTHYLHTINQVTKNPDIRLEDIPLLTDEERRLLLEDFNNTVRAYPEDMTLHGLFEKQVEKTPDRIAMVGRCRLMIKPQAIANITYSELNKKSNQLAHWLLEESVQSDTIVGIMAERSLEMIIGILGILKAGSAYLPIDPEYPEERIDYMLKDSGARFFVTTPGLSKKFEKLSIVNCQLLIVNEKPPACRRLNIPPKEANSINNYQLTINNLQLKRNSLAYLIYTSGTTGRPKGVLVKHESIVNTLLARKHEYAMESSHVALQLFSFSFDGFLTGFFTPVISGVKVIMMSDGGIKDPAKIAALIAGEQVTHFICIPSLYRVIMEALTHKQAASLQVVTLAGERLPADLLEITRHKNRQLELVNEYGVTEAAVMSTINRHQENCRQIKIGKPTRNTRIYILDKRQVLQPIGVPGELCISGIALARGYLNRPELTNQKFCLRRSGGTLFEKTAPPGPPRKNFLLGGKGLYRSHTSHMSYITNKSYIYLTGDLARWLPDGNIEFLGRIDHQVKIRGFRIELEEIRHRLLQHEQVRDAVVVDREERSGHRYLCAYIVAAGEPDAGDLKSHLSGQLPGFMVPAHFILLENIPLTSSGKVDCRKLPPPGEAGVLGHSGYVAPVGALEQQIAAIWEEIAGAGRIGRNDNFFDAGGNSLNALHIINRLKEELQLDIPLLGLFEYPTVGTFAGFLQREFLKGDRGEPGFELRDIDPDAMDKTRQRRKRKQAITGLEVAIIGMSCRFPGAEDIERFWENLRGGVESLTFLSMSELESEAAPGEILTNPAYVKSAGGILEGKEYFDAAFFGYTPLEAELLNPQTRVFYQCCWNALEHAAYNSFDSTKSIGLYAGADSGYLWQGGVLLSGKGSALGTFAVSLLAGEFTLCTRVSYHLNLKGPAVFVQTACSTSLTAIHLACQALLNSECYIALAGGVSVICGPRVGYLYQEGMVVSPDGHCRAFDAEARGTAGSEGCGVVVLKLLEEAVEDNDVIHAVIKSTALNNDGIRKVGYTAPSVQGQAETVHAALQMAWVEPESITYVETHGTGTPLGDSIEIKALTRAFKTTKRQYCAVGSVKTNIGHLGSAAGVAGLIKTVLAMRHRLIPPSLHYQRPNPGINFRDSPFYVNTRLREWTGIGGPLRAGVSSFGIGGTNVHAVVEEWNVPASARGETHRSSQLLLLSARTVGALEKITANLAHHFKNHPQLNLADAAYTLEVGRQGFGHRRMLVCKNLAGAVQALSDPGSRLVKNLEHASGKPPDAPAVIFIFSGVGAQYMEMGRGLYQDEPGFRRRMDRCFDILAGLGRPGLEEMLYPRQYRDRNPGWGMELSSIFIFILQYSLAGLLEDWGITPAAMIGYSFGEYAAACIAGVFSLEEALQLVAERGRLIEGTAPGAMLSVPLEAETLEPLLPPGVSLAVDNGPSCLVSGPQALVGRFQEEMKARKYVCMRLAVSTAVHSSTMDPILEPLAGTVLSLCPKAPVIPYISNVTGQWITGADVINPAYWTTHLRQTVRFARGIRELAKQHPRALYIEIGPSHDMRALVLRCLENNPRGIDPGKRVINLVKPAGSRMPDMDYLLDKLGRMWLYGVTPDWGDFHRGKAVRRIPLPGYPFGEDAAFYPVHTGVTQDRAMAAAVKPGQLEREPDLTRWFYLGTWKRLPYTRPVREEIRGNWLVFTAAGGSGISRRLTECLERHCATGEGGAAAKVVRVEAGAEYAEAGPDRYTVDPGNPGDYETLFRRLGASGTAPCRALHLWTLQDGSEDSDDRGDGVEQDLRLGFYSLLYLARAMAGPHGVEKGEITVVSSNMQDIAGEPQLCPGKMTLLGPINVIPQEYPGFGCCSLDIVVPPPGSREEDQLMNCLMEELLGGISDIIAAYRYGRRWMWDVEPVHPGPEAPAHLPPQVPGLRRGGVYLITGGMGKVGLILAEGLFREVGARLVLTGRSALPPLKEWDSIAAAAGPGDKTGQRIRRLLHLMEQGAEVLVLEADAADVQQMAGAVRTAEERFGPLNGVIHAAAITDGAITQPVASADKATCQRQFRPKIHGTRVLEKVLENKNLDFCLLMSSIASLLGGLGYVVYSAANLFMDGFVHYHNRHSPQRWISVNWDVWGESGDEGEDGSNSRGSSSGIGAGLRRLAMTPEKGFQVFKLAVSRRELYCPGQVVISTGDLGQRIKQWIKLEALDSPGTAAHGTQGTHATARPRPHLTSPYREPGTAAEKTLVQILEEILGYDRVGIEDDFFELGLDSIKIIQIRARLGQKGCRTEMGDFFQYPTVSQLAPRFRTTKPGNKEEPQAADIYPLTPMQEGMFYHSLYESINTQAYFEQLSYHLREDLDPELLRKSANQLVARHDILRTVFIHEGQERPMQKVLKERQVEFHYLDLRRAPDGGSPDRDTLVREYEEKQKQRPFDLSKDVLIRLTVLRLEDCHYAVIWSFHHIIMDGWCMSVLTSEFLEIYRGLREGRPPRLGAVRPFRDYVDWIERQDKAEAGEFWAGYLAGYEEPASIPRKKYPAGRRGEAALQEKYTPGGGSTTLEKEIADRLQQAAVKNRVTLNILFQAVWGIVLSVYSGRGGGTHDGDVVFGAVVSGRPAGLEGVENMIGCFINTVPVRVRYNRGTTFRQLAVRLREETVRAEPYHHYSLAEIQNRSPLKQDLLDHFQEFQNYPTARQIPGLEEQPAQEAGEKNLDPSRVRVFEQGNYDFVFSIIPGEPFILGFGYNANVYDNNLMTRLGRHTLRVLEQIAKNDAILVEHITLLSEGEKTQILFEFNHREDRLEWEQGVPGRIENQAALNPDGTALVYGGRYLTYRQLEQDSRQWAAVLRRYGVGRDRTAAIRLERSPLTAILILAVWKAGGAYIPLDAADPIQRLIRLLIDAAPALLITTPEPDSRLEEVLPGRIITLHHPADTNPTVEHPREQDAAEGRDPSPDRLAYVIYTSGSTGVPKGVMIHHGGMLNHIRAKIRELELTERCIVAQNATYTFDISVWQFFTALTLGGRVVIYPAALIMEPARFYRQVVKDSVTILEVVPSYLAMMLEAADLPGESSGENGGAGGQRLNLDYLLVTGEEVKPGLLERWFARHPGIKVVNAYGPTEASDDITHHIMDRPPAGDRVPIGRPLCNLVVSIVDRRGQLCPVGVKGEIHVAGTGVGRGYLNRPELTAEKFDHDFKDYGDYHDRKYRSSRSYMSYKSSTSYIFQTGDLGCWREQGIIEFFGRIDHQVKIRGFRIEPGEIERRLMGHPRVKEAVVTALKDGEGDPYLCAYFVPARPGQSTGDLTGDLKDYLSGVLPPYMVPIYFLELEKLSLTANGKVDRRGLPRPLQSTAPPAPPATALERKLAGLWEEVLSLPPGSTNIDDDFFRMGGHSLKAMLLLFKIHQQLDIKLPLAELFHFRTIRSLARFMENTAPQKFIPIAAVEKKEYYPLSPAQKRLYILQEMNPASTAYNLPQVHELPAVPGANPEEIIADIFRQLIRRHESLRTCFPVKDGEPIQRVLDEDEVEFQPEENRDKVVRPFDLTRAPLLRAGIFPTNTSKRLLWVDIHHIVTDGISNAVLLNDFMTLAESKTLAPLRIQYKDFSMWRHHLDEKGGLEKQEAYWLKEFAGELPVLDLPLDYTRPVPRDFSGAVESFRLKETTAGALRSMARTEGVTLYMLLSAFLHILLSKISGGEDIVVGSPVAGRGHIHLTAVMGMFVNTLPIRNFPVREKTFGEFLLEVKQRTLAAFENQDYPFEELVEKMAVHRDLGRNPLFDVLFMCETVETVVGGIDEQGGEEKKSREAGEQSSKFDMTWHALESGDRLTFSVVYCPALFKKETIQRFIAYFEQLVSSVLEGGREIKLGTVEIIPAAEKNRVLLEFNDTKVDYAGHNTLDRLFSLRVEQNPDYAAGLWTQSVVTYRELSREVGQLARQLRQKGIGSGVIVAVMMKRSPGMLIALYAILRAGGAYLPIDPSFPTQRIKYLLEDSRPSLIIIAETPAEEVDRICETVQLEVFAGIGGGVTEGDAPSPVSRTDPAYVIYTSGTTGRPRGVVVCHYSVVNRLQWMQKAYPAAPGDVMLQKTPFTFDVSVWELSWWYLGGAAVCLAAPGIEKDPAALIHVIERQRVTIIHFVPSMLGAFLEYAAAVDMAERLKSLRHVFASGEKLELDRVEMFNRLFAPLRRIKMPVPQLSNLYGPTEAAVDVSYYNCPPGEKPGLVPIGKPIHNTVLYILDQNMNHQPLGVTGELCICGVQVARGYLNRPELTAEKFDLDLWDLQDYHDEKKNYKLQNTNYKQNTKYKLQITNKAVPLGQVENAFGEGESHELHELARINEKFLRGGPGGAVFSKSAPPGRRRQRLYKTGDLARWLNDGNIEFLGRIDQQVKLRGYRIELGEIEARLREYPGVKEAVAAVKQDGDGNNYLCAYLVVSGTGATGEPGQYLSTVLPDYMIPSFFIYLEMLPRTPSGKIDHQALPLPDEGGRAGAAEYVPPDTPLENTLTELWREVLGIEKPGIRDNFFRLGGHSLAAIKLAGRLKNKGIHLSINEIFLYPTIQGQARRIGLNHELAVRAFGESFAAGNDPAEPTNAPGHAPLPEETWKLLQEQWARWDQGILNTREVNQYKMTAKQRMQLSSTSRGQTIPLFFHRGLDTGFLQETLLEMIENQGLLRSVFREQEGEWYWVEFSAPPGVSVPFVDLTDRPPEMREPVMGEIVMRLLKEDFGQNSLLYRVVCFKRDIREYVLVIVIDHIIYDGMSREIITREITTAYLLKETGREQPRVRPVSYADYAAHILQGPRGIGPAELIEMFDLKAFAAAERELERTILEKDGPIKLFTHEIPFPAGMGEERAWEFAFWYFVLFTGRALGMRELPLKIATYGRRCGEKTFFDTLGDFADLVPVLVRIDGKNSRQMASTASERIERASRHSINFMTLVSEPSLREKWQEAIRLLMAGKSAVGDAMLVFNLVGRLAEDRIRGFKPGVVIQGKEMKRSAIQAEIYYGPRSLYIYLTTSLNIEGFGDIGGFAPFV